MSDAIVADLRGWPTSRWCGLIALVFTFQLGLIFWLSDRKPLPAQAHAPVPELRLADGISPELLALSDSTLFALPHRLGFSGRAWMKPPEPEFHPLTWSSSPEWLRLPKERPGVAFYEFVRTNSFGSPRPPAAPEFALTLPEVVPLSLSRERSRLRVEGELANRELLTKVELKSRPSAELLSNSVVQVVVDAAGRPRTATLVERSGSAEADGEALARSAVMRFAPLSGGGSAASTRGLLLFEWHTVCPPSTNAIASRP